MAKKGKLFNIDPVKQLQKLENFGHSIHGRIVVVFSVFSELSYLDFLK